MNAICIYISAAQLVLQTDTVDAACQQRLLDLQRLLPNLRQLLSCVVCCRLLTDPYAPRHARCQHNVCRLCVRGRKSLRPYCATCKDCQDFKTYDENRQMNCLLLCYKSLCEHLMGSTLFNQLSKQRLAPAALVANSATGSPCISLPQMSIQEFVLEGASYDNILSTFNMDLPRNVVIPRLQFPASIASHSNPPLSINAATPLAPNTAMHLLSLQAGSQTASKAATPPVPLSTPPPPLPPPLPPLLKQETGSSKGQQLAVTISPTKSHVSTMTSPSASALTVSSLPPALTPSFSLKNLKNIVELSTSVANSGTASTSPPTITYVGPNNPGIVVPMVSSSATTTAPLTIASAKLQSLNRQLAQARNAKLSVSSSSSSAACIASTSASSLAGTQPPLTLKVTMSTAVPVAAQTAAAALASISATTVTPSSTSTTSTITSQQVRNPPPIKTVSNGSAMYSVLYTGIGNKITIKRKTDGDEDNTQRKNASTSAPPPTLFRQMAKTNNTKRRGCRCGNATPTPGKLTCCGQRCPCYVDSKSCIGCKCRGCRNPHRPDGGKVRPVIPELACYEIQMADENSSLSPNELPIATSTTTATSAGTPSPPSITTSYTTVTSTEGQAQTLQQEPLGHTIPQTHVTLPHFNVTSATTTGAPSPSTATLIPLRNLQQFAVAAQQQQQQQQAPVPTQTQLQAHSGNSTVTVSSGSGGLQLESLQRESVLIQNMEGKYQVVNVYTTGATTVHSNSSSQLTNLTRNPHPTLSQLQTQVTASNSGNSATTYYLSNATTSSAGSPTLVACTSTGDTTALPQILVQQQPHQHQPPPRLGTSTSISSNSHAHLPLQVQQQLKQSNIITVHPIPISASAVAASTSTGSSLPLMAAATTPNTTITLSPIIVTSPAAAGYSADMYSDSSEDFASLKSGTTNTSNNSCSSASSSSILTVPLAQASPLSLRTASAGTTSISTISTTAAAAHLTPAMVEVIESNEL